MAFIAPYGIDSNSGASWDDAVRSINSGGQIAPGKYGGAVNTLDNYSLSNPSLGIVKLEGDPINTDLFTLGAVFGGGAGLFLLENIWVSNYETIMDKQAYNLTQFRNCILKGVAAKSLLYDYRSNLSLGVDSEKSLWTDVWVRGTIKRFEKSTIVGCSIEDFSSRLENISDNVIKDCNILVNSECSINNNLYENTFFAYRAFPGESVSTVNGSNLVDGVKYMSFEDLTVNGQNQKHKTFTYNTGDTVVGNATVYKSYTLSEFKTKFVDVESLAFTIEDNVEGDPLFVETEYYTYSESSPAKNIAIDGSDAGWAAIASIEATTDGMPGVINGTWNLGINGYEPTDPDSDMEVEFPVKDMGNVRILEKVLPSGESDQDNGQYFDTENDYFSEFDDQDYLSVLPLSLTDGETYYNDAFSVVVVEGSPYDGSNIKANMVNRDLYKAVTGDRVTQATPSGGSDFFKRISQKPRKSTTLIRWSTVSSGDVATKTYRRFIIGQMPLIDGNGTANGEPGYDPNITQVKIAARWWQEKSRLKTRQTAS